MLPLLYLPSHTPSLVMALGEEVTAPVDTSYVLDTLSISYLVLNIKCSVLCSSTTTKCNRTIIVLVQYCTVQYCTIQYSTVKYSTVLYSTCTRCKDLSYWQFVLCCVSCIAEYLFQF